MSSCGYEINIYSKSGEIITLTTNLGDNTSDSCVKKVNFKMNTVDDSVVTHSDAIRAEIEIEGNINQQSKSEIKKIADWAIATEQSELYRKIEIRVNENGQISGDWLRLYTVEDVFVLDYEEKFGEGGDQLGQYKLNLVQRSGNHNIKIFDK